MDAAPAAYAISQYFPFLLIGMDGDPHSGQAGLASRIEIVDLEVKLSLALVLVLLDQFVIVLYVAEQLFGLILAVAHGSVLVVAEGAHSDDAAVGESGAHGCGGSAADIVGRDVGIDSISPIFCQGRGTTACKLRRSRVRRIRSEADEKTLDPAAAAPGPCCCP